MRRVLVTGSDGFIGGRLVREFLMPMVDRGEVERLHLTDRRSDHDLGFKTKFWDVDTVFHLAAEMGVARSMREPLPYLMSNVWATGNLLSLVPREAKVVLASSVSVYGLSSSKRTKETEYPVPASVYGATKLLQERMCRDRGNCVVLRLFCTYGPGQALQGDYGLVGVFTHQVLREGRPMVYDDGSQTRDLVYVDDVCRAMVQAASWSTDTVMNVGTGQPTAVVDLARRVTDLFGGDDPWVIGSARPGGGDVRHAVADISTARSLGWEPTVGLTEGLGRWREWVTTTRPRARAQASSHAG